MDRKRKAQPAFRFGIEELENRIVPAKDFGPIPLDPGKIDQAANHQLVAAPPAPSVAAGPTIQSAPAAPPGSTATTTAFTQSAPTAIPTGPAVVTSTVVVAGAGSFLFDLDLTTNLKHTFGADLDITLTSPVGTVVTLTTDNGAGNDNIFNGTLWDDDANPGGTVPYTTNNGVVSDHAYVNLTVATPLTPEEPFGAFIGEDPNGTWTITISDDLAGDGGSLDSWTLHATTLPTAPVVDPAVQFTQSTPVAIPTGPAVVTSTLAVSGLPTYLFDVDLVTNLTHTFGADLDVTLTSPAGTVVTLTTDNGAGNDNIFNGTRWDDDANPGGTVPYTTNNGVANDHAYVNLTAATPLTPVEPLAAFIGEDPNGTWTITISDDLAGDGGSLDSWTLDFETISPPPPPPPPPTPTPTPTPMPTPTPTPTPSIPPTPPSGPAVCTRTDVNGCFVERLYYDLLGRGLDDLAEPFIQALDAGAKSRKDVVSDVLNSREYLARAVTGLYGRLLDRAPGEAELAPWIEEIQHGTSLEDVAAQIASSDEYRSRFADEQAFVESLYMTFLGRQADREGLASFLSRHAARDHSQTSARTIALEVIESREGRAVVVDFAYNLMLNRPGDQPSQDHFVARLHHLSFRDLLCEMGASEEYFAEHRLI